MPNDSHCSPAESQFRTCIAERMSSESRLPVHPANVGAKRCLQVVLIAALSLPLGTASQSPPTTANAPGIASKLQRAGVLDNYFPEVVQEVAVNLLRAGPTPWQGVQVNGAHRAGWVNIYMIDARRLPKHDLLAEEGIQNLTAENLRGGALAHEETATIFINTVMSKRLTAATLMTQTKVQPDLTAALATVDAAGLDAVRKFWDPATLSANTDANQRVGWLLRGATAFVLAHEIGHLRIGQIQGDEPDRLRLAKLTERQQDEIRACPELMHKESRQRQAHERAADAAAVTMLGQQCRIGDDGKLRHAIYLLGTSWYFLASMSDKLLEMARNTDSPFIAQALRAKIGADLYQHVVAAQAAERRRGAVQFAFPLSHPPDTERMQAIEAGLRKTPCGGEGLDSAGAQMLEMLRVQTCRRIIEGAQTR